MRFYEIASPRLKLVATKRFVKNTAFYSRGGYPAFEKTLRQFLDFKTQNPREPFNRKDSPFVAGSPLAGYAHCHLVHGKVVVIYAVKDNELRLYDVTEHDTFEGKGMQTLRAYLRSADLEPVGQSETKASLSAEQKAELDELFYEIAAQEREVINDALKNDWSHLFDYIRMVIDEETAADEVIFAAYGGKNGMAKFLAAILKNLGYK